MRRIWTMPRIAERVVMGPGCRRLTCTHEKGTDVVTGQWQDGRLAGVRGIRAGKSDYGFLAFTDKGVTHVPLSGRYMYRDLLKGPQARWIDKRELPKSSLGLIAPPGDPFGIP